VRRDGAEKDSRSQRFPRFACENFDRNQILVERVKAIAEQRAAKAGQLTLAWVPAKGEDMVPILGTKRRKYLEENAAVAEIKLTAAEVAELEAVVPQNEIAGDRYTAQR
jgi:aryl-alcohol dehydrogenase-like predicted oxidoreductase